MIRSFFDTNVLVYAWAANDPRLDTAEALLEGGGTIGVQNLNGFVAVAAGKLRLPWREVADRLSALRVLFPSPIPLTVEVHEIAVRISAAYGYHIYDALSIAAALEAGCTTLYSEDMQDGHTISGLTIRNPFR